MDLSSGLWAESPDDSAFTAAGGLTGQRGNLTDEEYFFNGCPAGLGYEVENQCSDFGSYVPEGSESIADVGCMDNGNFDDSVGWGMACNYSEYYEKDCTFGDVVEVNL